MRNLALIFAVLLGYVAFGLTEDIEKDEGVYVLNTKNYESATKDGVREFKHLLVYFYAPWCGHCKAFTPEYVKAAQILREKDSDIKLAKVNGPEEEALLEQNHVTGYPTLFFYREGLPPIKYTGGRMANEIAGWVEKKTGPAAVELPDADAVKEFVSDNEVAVVGFFKDAQSKEAKKYLDVVRDFEGYPCGIVSDEKAFEAHEAKDGQVVLFKQFDERKAVYEGAIGAEQLIEFIHRYAVPLVTEFNHETAQKIFKGLVKSHLLVFISKTSDGYEEVRKTMQELAEPHRNEVMFVVVDVDEDDNRRVVEFLGVESDGDKFPTMRIIQMKEDDIVKYRSDSAEVNEETIKKFVEDYKEGKVQIHYKSEALPDDWDKKPVKVLTASNFDSVALDKSKNALVEFYAPWCGHCKQLAPVWEKLAETLEDQGDVVVAKIDATLNELPHTQVRSFPTIYLYHKETNERSEYNGERTLEGIKKFLDTKGEYGKAAPDHDEL